MSYHNRRCPVCNYFLSFGGKERQVCEEEAFFEKIWHVFSATPEEECLNIGTSDGEFSITFESKTKMAWTIGTLDRPYNHISIKEENKDWSKYKDIIKYYMKVSVMK